MYGDLLWTVEQPSGPLSLSGVVRNATAAEALAVAQVAAAEESGEHLCRYRITLRDESMRWLGRWLVEPEKAR